jgi:CO/xanthine dehydrogenase FAD-binding subunit
MVTIGDYRRVRSVDEILAVFTSSSHPARVLAGGTDLLTRLETDSPDRILVVDIGDVSELAGISSTGSGLRIGAATKLADIENSELLDGLWQVLARSAAQVGSPQIRNLATIGGNICNASPAADTVPPLLVLDAEVELISPRGVRKVPLVDFFVGSPWVPSHPSRYGQRTRRVSWPKHGSSMTRSSSRPHGLLHRKPSRSVTSGHLQSIAQP